MAFQNPTAPGGSGMDIGHAFTFVFEDPEWIKKVLIGGVVTIIPIVNFAALGYMITTLRNVTEGNPRPLPEWSDFGGLFMKGLFGFLGALVLMIPVILLACCMAAIGGTLGAQSTGDTSSGSGTGGIIGTLLICVYCIMAVYMIAFLVYWYAALTRYALNGQFAAFWDFRGNLAFIQANPGSYIIALLLTIVAGIVGGLGGIACGIGALFTGFYAQQVIANIFGQYARQIGGAAAAPMSPMAPPPTMTPPPPLQ